MALSKDFMDSQKQKDICFPSSRAFHSFFGCLFIHPMAPGLTFLSAIVVWFASPFQPLLCLWLLRGAGPEAEPPAFAGRLLRRPRGGLVRAFFNAAVSLRWWNLHNGRASMWNHKWLNHELTHGVFCLLEMSGSEITSWKMFQKWNLRSSTSELRVSMFSFQMSVPNLSTRPAVFP